MLSKTLIKIISIFQALLLILFFVLYNFYHIKNSKLNKQLGYQDYCRKKKYPELCKKDKFSKYLIIYYDGLGEFFLKN